ncbi:hypothetical protein DENSPDRAFT_887093 [Dentipellis sp. KUC8613]|nr:hypothetical protein DENSPDRAFT_887093 [Dentipellis sp. KUC8613]
MPPPPIDWESAVGKFLADRGIDIEVAEEFREFSVQWLTSWVKSGRSKPGDPTDVAYKALTAPPPTINADLPMDDGLDIEGLAPPTEVPAPTPSSSRATTVPYKRKSTLVVETPTTVEDPAWAAKVAENIRARFAPSAPATSRSDMEVDEINGIPVGPTNTEAAPADGTADATTGPVTPSTTLPAPTTASEDATPAE